MTARWSFSGCHVHVKMGVPARCRGLDVTLSVNPVTSLGFSSKFYSCVKAMSEHTNKYGVYFVHAVNTPALFLYTVCFVFFFSGENTNAMCMKIYIKIHTYVSVYVYMCIFIMCLYTYEYIWFNEEQKHNFL